MKSISIKRGARAGIAVFALALIAFVAFKNWIPGGASRRASVLLSDDLVRRGPTAPSLKVLIPTSALYAPAILANGGTGLHEEGLFNKHHGVSVDLHIEEDANACLELLSSGKADLVWMSTDSLARAYPLIRSINPVAILLAGYSRGGDLVVARSLPASPRDYRTKRIACAAYTPHHFMMLYLLSLAGVRPDEVKWRLTRTPADAARLFARGKADICAAGRRDMGALPGRGAGTRVLLSTEDAPGIFTGLLVARESTVALQKEHLAGFVKGWFEGLDSMTGDMGPAEELIAREFKTDAADARSELENCSFAGYAENRAFFSIDDAEWDGFANLFDKACALYHGEYSEGAPLSGFARNTDLLVSLEKELRAYRSPGKQRPLAPSAGGEPLPGTITLRFPLNGIVPEFESRGELARFARDAHAFSGCAIALYGREDPAEDRWRNLAPQRAREAARILVSRHRIPPARIVLPGERPTEALPGDGDARGVDARLVAPRRGL